MRGEGDVVDNAEDVHTIRIRIMLHAQMGR